MVTPNVIAMDGQNQKSQSELMFAATQINFPKGAVLKDRCEYR